MGTINYGTSDFITLGIKPYNPEDFESDSGWLDFIRDEWGIDTEDPEAVRDAAYEDIGFCYEDDRENFDSLLDKYRSAAGGFWFFHIKLEPGYYEGLYIDIENNFPVAFNDYVEKRDAQKEITRIKAFFRVLAGCGFVACFPGWCMGYSDYKTTLKEIDSAIRDMRETVKNTPTWAQYNRG